MYYVYVHMCMCVPIYTPMLTYCIMESSFNDINLPESQL